MTCEEVNRELDTLLGGARIPESVRRHMHGCPQCQALYDFLLGGTGTGMDAVPGAVQDRITRQVVSDLKPVKPLPSGAWLSLGFLAIFAIVSALFVAVSGMRGAMKLDMGQFAGMLGIIGGAAFLLAITLSREMVPGQKRLLSPPQVFLILMMALLAGGISFFPWEFQTDFVPPAWHCFSTGFLYSLPAAGLIVFYLRRGAAFSLGLLGAGAGLLAGLVGVVVLHFACWMHQAPHVVFAHLGVPFVGAIVGYLIGHYALGWLPKRSPLES